MKPDSVKASSLLYMTTTLVRLYFSLAFLTVCGMTWASVRESRKMKSPCSVIPVAVLETARTGVFALLGDGLGLEGGVGQRGADDDALAAADEALEDRDALSGIRLVVLDLDVVLHATLGVQLLDRELEALLLGGAVAAGRTGEAERCADGDRARDRARVAGALALQPAGGTGLAVVTTVPAAAARGEGEHRRRGDGDAKEIGKQVSS